MTEAQGPDLEDPPARENRIAGPPGVPRAPGNAHGSALSRGQDPSVIEETPIGPSARVICFCGSAEAMFRRSYIEVTFVCFISRLCQVPYSWENRDAPFSDNEGGRRMNVYARHVSA